MNNKLNPKWSIAFLSAFSGAFCVGAPMIAMSVLFDQISTELHLTIVQVGMVWSFGSLFGILSALISGALGDTIGPRRVVVLGILIVSLAGAARALAPGFYSLLLCVSIYGYAVPMITTGAFKLNGVWFPRKQLGMANGIFGMGMAFGFLLGSILTATILSPWLGGWRPVMVLYGGISLLLLIPWLFIHPSPQAEKAPHHTSEKPSIVANLGRIVKVKNVWLIGITLFGVSGTVQAILGYLPLYLRNQGWEIVAADGTLSVLNALGMISVIPITIWSDRLHARKNLLIGLIFLMMVGTFLLAIERTAPIWLGAILVGLGRDAVIVLLMTMVLESDGIGPVLAGTANGLVMVFMMSGNFLAPPIGNNFAENNPSFPFLFWGGLTLTAFIAFQFVRNPMMVQNTPVMAEQDSAA